jgi:hypothetical protein
MVYRWAIMVAASRPHRGQVCSLTSAARKSRRLRGTDQKRCAHHRHSRDELTVELVRKYDDGASIRQLAEDTGRSYGFVHQLLVDAGVTLRGRGDNTRRKDK